MRSSKEVPPALKKYWQEHNREPSRLEKIWGVFVYSFGALALGGFFVDQFVSFWKDIRYITISEMVSMVGCVVVVLAVLVVVAWLWHSVRNVVWIRKFIVTPAQVIFYLTALLAVIVVIGMCVVDTYNTWSWSVVLGLIQLAGFLGVPLGLCWIVSDALEKRKDRKNH